MSFTFRKFLNGLRQSFFGLRSRACGKRRTIVSAVHPRQAITGQVGPIVGIEALENRTLLTITFFVDNQVGFNAAVSGVGSLAGTEDFESSNLAANSITNFGDPLSPGVANGPFLTGTNPATGLTVQANTLGNSPTTPSPRGASAISTASAGYVSTPNDQVSVNNQADSFDMLFALPGAVPVKAVSFIPLVFDNAANVITDTMTVRVYDASNNLLGSTTLTGGNYATEGSFLGLITDGTAIARVNINDSSSSTLFAGADNIKVYGAATTPSVNLSVTANTGTEAGTTAITVTATASGVVSGDQTVNLGVSGTGITASDYSLTNTQITIPNGQTTGSVTFTVQNDSLVEGPETATLTISSPSAGITLGATTTQNIAITDNDTDTLTISSPTVTEGNAGTTTMTFTVTSPTAVAGGFTVGFSVANVTTSAADYTLATISPLTFTGTAGEQHTITFNVNGDTVVEGNETFTVTLGTVTPVAPVPAASIVSGAAGTGTINNDDSSTLTIDSPTVTEGNSGTTTMTFTVTSSAGVAGGFTVGFTVANVTTNNSDYTVVTISPLTFTGTAGEQHTITINVIGDAIVEGTETLTVTLGTVTPVAPVAAASIVTGAAGTGTITNDDSEILTIDSPTITEGNSGTTALTFTVTSPSVVQGGFTVAFTVANVTTSNGDYTVATSSPITFTGTAGETHSITINVNGDTAVEGNESLTVTLGTVTPVAPVLAGSITTGATGTGTINNDDNDTLIIDDPIVSEGDSGVSSLTFTVTSPNAVEGGFKVDFSVINGLADASDYSVGTVGPLTFAGLAGETQTITINVSGDALVEGDEDLAVTLGAVSNTVAPVSAANIISGASGTGLIANDDISTLTIDSPNIIEGDSGSTTLAFTVTSPTAVDGGFSVAFNVAGLTANAADYTVVTNSPLVFTGTAGESHTILVSITGDAIVEGDETFKVTLGAVTPVAPVQAASIVSGASGTGMIVNDDQSTLTIDSPTITEGDSGTTTLTFTVTSPLAVQGGFTVAFNVADVTTGAGDYTLMTSSPLSFSGTAGETQIITINVNGDQIVEGDETLTVTLGTVTPALPVQAGSIITGAAGTGTIQNDDLTTLTIDSPTVTEGDSGTTVMTFHVTSPQAVQSGFTVAFNVNDLLTSPGDYSVVTTTPLTFAGTAGETQTITINVIGDTVVEQDENLYVALGAVTSTSPVDPANIHAGVGGFGTITNDDKTTLSVSSPTVVEGDSGTTALVFNVTSSNAVQSNFQVQFSIADVTTNSADYSLQTSNPLLFSGTAGEIQTITLQVNGDHLVEGDETLTATLGPAAAILSIDSADLITGASGTGTITNDDSTTLSITSPTVTEGDNGVTALTFAVTSSNAVSGGFSVPFNVAGITTSAGDYTVVTNSPLVFAGTAGETQFITVNVTGDTVVEGDETFTATLGAATTLAPVQATSIVTGAAGTGTITNDDTTTLSISSPTVTEGNAGTIVLTFTVTSPNAVEGGFTVPFNVTDISTDGTDYTVSTVGPLTFAGTAGETQTITVNVVGDTIVEGDETFSVALGAATPVAPVQTASIVTSATGTGTITNDDTTTLTISSPTIVEGDNGTTAAIFTVTSPNAVQGGFSVAFSALNGTTSVGEIQLITASPLVFAGTAGESHTITVNVFNDLVVEPDENFSVTLGAVTPVSPVSAANIVTGEVGTGIIDDNDTATVGVINTGDGVEATTLINGRFNVTQSKVSSTDTVVNYTVTGTATASSDYTTLSGTVTIPAGQLFATVDVAVLDDTLVEDTESVVITLTGLGSHDADISLDATPGATTTTVFITSDDVPIITSAATATVAENTPAATVVLDVDADGALIAAGHTLTYSLLGVDAGLFNINSATGELTFKNSPNFEAPADLGQNNVYEVTVIVTADVSPAKLTTQDVTITVTPVNDNVPVFANASPTFTIVENSAAATVVGGVSATDADLPAQSLTYSIVSGNTSGAFAINPTTGQITVASSTPLDFEVTPTFTLTVRVTDNTPTALTADAVVVIHLTDVFEGPTIHNPAPTGTYHLTKDPAFVLPDASFDFENSTTPDYSAAKLTVSITSGASKKDELSIVPKGDGRGQINLKGKKVRFGDVEIGKFEGGNAKKGDLIVTFNAHATTAAVDNLIRRISFFAKDDAGVNRTISFALTGVSGQDSNVVVRNLQVVP